MMNKTYSVRLNLLFILFFVISTNIIFAQENLSPYIVKIINESKSTFESYPEYFINIDGTLYFTANDGTNGIELWKSDGTTNGTVLIKKKWSD